MKILDKIKKMWNRLGEPDVDMPSEKEAENILKSAGLNSSNGGTAKKEVVEKIKTKPVSIEDIIPEPKQNDLERE